MVYEKVNKVIYLEVLKSIYNVLQSALLSYITMRKYLEIYGFKLNSYGLYVATNILEVELLTVVFHVDDIKESHKGGKGGRLF